MNSGKTGMGNSKHRKSGKASKSPKARYNERLQAERNEVKLKSSNCKYDSVSELFK